MAKTLTINWQEEFRKLFPEETVKDIPDNYEVCETCEGRGWTKGTGFINSCRNCYGRGMIQVACPDCGGPIERSRLVCKDCAQKKQAEQDAQRRVENFEKAEAVIALSDYDGYLSSLYNEDRVVDRDDFIDEYLEMEPEDRPDWVYATKPVKCLDDIDLYDVITRAAEDGYEDMLDRLDMKSNLLAQAQALIDQWVKDQGDAVNAYYPDYKRIVVLNLEGEK